MNSSSALHEPAQDRRALVRRASLTAVAAATALTLVLPTGATAAPSTTATTVTANVTTVAAPAAALTTTTSTVKPNLTVKRSDPRQVKGETRVKLTIRAGLKGKAVAGKVRIDINGKHVTTKKLTKGKASYRLAKSLRLGKKKIKVSFLPAASTTKTSAGTVRPLAGTARTVRVRVISQSKALRDVALKYVGVRYRYGGTSPSTGFDCAGFVRYVYKKAGVADLPRSSSSQRYVGKVVSRKRAKVGDIIWTPGHVGIYLGGSKQIDAPRPGKTIQVRKIWQSNPVFINL